MTVMALKKKNNMKKGPFKMKSPTKFGSAGLHRNIGHSPTGKRLTNPKITSSNPNTNRLLAAAKSGLGGLSFRPNFSNMGLTIGSRIKAAPGFKPKTRVGKRGLRGFLSRFF